MLPDRVSNPGPLTYESGALPIALRGPPGPCKEPFLHLALLHCKAKLSNFMIIMVSTVLGIQFLAFYGK